jgi:predicted DNA-binding transcriptional regulator AlpA
MDGFYSIKEAERLVGVKRETFRRWENDPYSDFPRRRRLSRHPRGRCGYLRSELDAWIKGRPPRR